MTNCLMSQDVPRRRIRYQADTPQAMWEDIASRPEDLEAATHLAAAVMSDIGKKRLWRAAWSIGTGTAYALALRRSGQYVGESDYLSSVLAEGLLSRADMAGLQRLYTLAHAGCSAVMGWDETARRMVHFRCLDWPSAPAIAKASRLYEAVGRNGTTAYRSAGILGLVGCLTAVKPGFSVAINFAPWTGPSISPNPDPTFLLRQLMESPVDSYAEAKAMMQAWRPSAPLFLTLCGTRTHEACIIALGAAWSRHRSHMTEIGARPWLVQTNHHDPDGPFAAHNRCATPDRPLLHSSTKRAAMIGDALAKDAGAGLERTLRQVFTEEPVWNHQTAQWVTMIPATGEMRLEARI